MVGRALVVARPIMPCSRARSIARCIAKWAPIWPIELPPSTTRQAPRPPTTRGRPRGSTPPSVSFRTYSGTRSTPCEWTPPRSARTSESASRSASCDDMPQRSKTARTIASSSSAVTRCSLSRIGAALLCAPRPRRSTGLAAQPGDAGARHRLDQEGVYLLHGQARVVIGPGAAHDRDLGRDPAEVAVAVEEAEPARPVDLALARVDELVAGRRRAAGVAAAHVADVGVDRVRCQGRGDALQVVAERVRVADVQVD